MQGAGLPPAQRHPPRHLLETILQFLRLGRLAEIQHPLTRGDRYPLGQGKVGSGQGFEENQAAVAVGEGVKKLYRNPVTVVQYANGAAPHLPPGHMN